MTIRSRGIIVSIQGTSPGPRAGFSYTIRYNDPTGGTCDRPGIRSAFGAPWEAQGLHTFAAQPGDGFPVDIDGESLHAWIQETQKVGVCP